MSMMKYVKERADDLLPRSMKGLHAGAVSMAADRLGMASDVSTRRFLKDGRFTLITKTSYVADENAMITFCVDCADWFRDKGLEVTATNPPCDLTNEYFAEVSFDLKEPDAEKSSKLAATLRDLFNQLQEQAQIDSSFSRRK